MQIITNYNYQMYQRFKVDVVPPTCMLLLQLKNEIPAQVFLLNFQELLSLQNF